MAMFTIIRRGEVPPCYLIMSSPPPEYEEEQRELLPFETEEPPTEESEETNWLIRVREFGKEALVVPVRHVLDPVVHFWHTQVEQRFDQWISPHANPLIVRRTLVLVLTATAAGFVYFTKPNGLSRDSGLSHQQLRENLWSYLDSDSMLENLNYLGGMPHNSGTVADRVSYMYVRDTLRNLGIAASLNRHEVMISHPNSTLLEYGDFKTDFTRDGEPLPLMSLAIDGEARGPLVYANYGDESDFSWLETNGISLKDKVVLVRFSQAEPGMIARYAESLGVKAVLFMPHKHPTAAMWPDGPDYPIDSVQQENLGEPGIYPGDVLSPGWVAELAQRIKVEDAYIPHIPVQCLSWQDAKVLLEDIGGKKAPEGWEQPVPSLSHGWCTGPSETDVYLKVQPEVEERHQIANVESQIIGAEQPDEAVILGARLDSYCYGASQLGGLVVLLEVAKALANLRFHEHWAPRRTVYLMAWDGTEQNLAGSTEWGESVSDKLASMGIAYFDLDGVAGSQLDVRGNPLLDVEHLLQEIKLGNNTELVNVRHKPQQEPLEGYGNWIPFDPHTGVPSMRLGFVPGPDEAVPRGSCADTLEWMQHYGDPDMSRHMALAQLVSAAILDLADMPALPYNIARLGDEIGRYASDLATAAASEDIDLNLSELVKAGEPIVQGGIAYQAWVDAASEAGSTSLRFDSNRLFWNQQISRINKLFLDRSGLPHPKRNWYKNVLFGPQLVTPRGDHLSGTFPGVRDALQSGNAEMAQTAVDDVVRHLGYVTDLTSGIIWFP